MKTKSDIAELQERWAKANKLEDWEKFAIEMCPNADPDHLRREAWECHYRFENVDKIWKDYFVMNLIDYSDSIDNIYKMWMILTNNEESAEELTQISRDFPLPALDTRISKQNQNT